MHFYEDENVFKRFERFVWKKRRIRCILDYFFLAQMIFFHMNVQKIL